MGSRQRTIVLAARGTPRHPPTDETPKTSPDVGGRSIFQHIEAFVDRGDVGERCEAAFVWLLDEVSVGFVGVEEAWPEIGIRGNSDRPREQRG